jgi:RND family efflux transporter MFP subunit
MSHKKHVKMVILRILILIGVIAALAIGGRALVLRKRASLKKSPQSKMGATPVSVSIVRRGDLQQVHDYPAVVEPFRVTSIAARVTARIDSVLRKEGDRVKAGDPLLALDDRQTKLSMVSSDTTIKQSQVQLTAAKAALPSLQKTCKYWTDESARDAALATKGTISSAEAEATQEKLNGALGQLIIAEQNLNVIEMQIASHKSKKNELETTLGYYSITSPFDGIVTTKMVYPGDMATPGKPLLVISDDTKLKLSFDVPQCDLNGLKVGGMATFTVNGAQKSAAISRIYPSFNKARMVRIEALLTEVGSSDLALGTYLTVSVQVKKMVAALIIPADAIVERLNDTPTVFVVNDGTLETRDVALLGKSGNTVAVTGVAEGDAVVTTSFLGWARLAPGMSVEVKK